MLKETHLALFPLDTCQLTTQNRSILFELEFPMWANINHITIVQQESWRYVGSSASKLLVHIRAVDRLAIPNVDMAGRGRVIHDHVYFTVIS